MLHASSLAHILPVAVAFALVGPAGAAPQNCTPGFLPTFDAGEGTNGRVRDLCVFDDGTGPALFAAGDFLMAGGELRNRILAITLLHQQLYQQPELHAVRTRDYLPPLLENLRHSLSRTEQDIALSYELDACSLPVGTAITLGLIVSELVTNAYRHAFPDGRAGVVKIALERPLEGNEAVLAVSDNGVGMSETPSGGMGLGTRLIAGLTSQLQGKQAITRDSGVKFELTFPVER